MASWTGSSAFATKRQLISSISGLYADIQDISGLSFQNLEVSTLTASRWLSAPVLYVSDIIGANLDISGITITKDGILNAPVVSLSTLSLKGLDSLLDLDVSFDLGLGQALGGLLGGLGAVVGGGLIAAGTGVGLAVKGAEEGIATIVAGRPQNYMNTNVYEQINFQTQLQISTLGNLYPLYSTIERLVSSTGLPDVTPGKEIFVSTFFLPGTQCIRSMSDPFHLITGDSNLNTSTIQSFGQWVPLNEGLLSTFPDISLSNNTNAPLLDMERIPKDVNQLAMIRGLQYQNSSNDLPFPIGTPYPNVNNTSQILYHRDEFQLTNSFISTPYVRFQSTITNSATYFLRSSISTLGTWGGAAAATAAELTYSNAIANGNFAICEPDETGFRSTATFDFIAQNRSLFIQWGLAAGNFNSTIAANTAKRVSWNIPANTSNFIDIPQAVSTVSLENTQQIFGIETNPYEIRFRTLGTAMAPSMMAFDVSGMMFGSNTALSNYQNYPYQFNSSVFINGTLEAQTVIALSTIYATSTFIESQISSSTIEADLTRFVKMNTQEGYISTLKSTSNNWANDYIHSRSRHRFEGYATPISIVTGNNTGGIYDNSSRFDFNTGSFDQSFTIRSAPGNTNLMTFNQTDIDIANLSVGTLIADTLVYANATAPYLETSTIRFGWTGNFSPPQPPNFTLQQTLTTPPGLVYNNYTAASNQVLKIAAFSNAVTMLAQQFSTPLTYQNTTFSDANIQGWASTIFFNNGITPFARVNLQANTGFGELSLQAQTNPITVSMNTLPGTVGGLPVNVPVGSTYKFTSGGASWTTANLPPIPGTITYQNEITMSLDFENFTLSTTDTINLTAEKINLNGIVQIPDVQFDNLLVNNWVSSTRVIADSFNGYEANTVFTGSYNSAGSVLPLNLNYVINSTDFTNIRSVVNPSRGYNLFNSFNLEEWNNTQWNIDTSPTIGRPIIIVGEVLQLSPPISPYAGQFWINNAIDTPPLVIPIYQNLEGQLSTIGLIAGNTYARVYTTNGTNWFIQTNVPNPQGITPVSYSNYYQVQLNSELTTINSGMPLIYNNPSLTYYNNKTIFYSPQIRVATIDAIAFNTREAGMERTSYFDASVVFSGGPELWQSDAFNPILNIYSNSYYSIAGWECYATINRVRTDNDIPMGFEIVATPYPVGGGINDFVWGSARFISVRTIGPPAASLRENYLMIPKNYFNFQWVGQGPIIN